MVATVLAGPAIVDCSGQTGSLALCLRGKIAAAGLLPKIPPASEKTKASQVPESQPIAAAPMVPAPLPDPQPLPPAPEAAATSHPPTLADIPVAREPGWLQANASELADIPRPSIVLEPQPGVLDAEGARPTPPESGNVAGSVALSMPTGRLEVSALSVPAGAAAAGLLAPPVPTGKLSPGPTEIGNGVPAVTAMRMVPAPSTGALEAGFAVPSGGSLAAISLKAAAPNGRMLVGAIDPSTTATRPAARTLLPAPDLKPFGTGHSAPGLAGVGALGALDRGGLALATGAMGRANGADVLHRLRSAAQNGRLQVGAIDSVTGRTVPVGAVLLPRPVLTPFGTGHFAPGRVGTIALAAPDRGVALAEGHRGADLQAEPTIDLAPALERPVIALPGLAAEGATGAAPGPAAASEIVAIPTPMRITQPDPRFPSVLYLPLADPSPGSSFITLGPLSSAPSVIPLP